VLRHLPKDRDSGLFSKENADKCLQEAGLCRIDYYVNGHRKRIGLGERLVEAMQSKRYMAK
jgi:hypothetical protein